MSLPMIIRVPVPARLWPGAAVEPGTEMQRPFLVEEVRFYLVTRRIVGYACEICMEKFGGDGMKDYRSPEWEALPGPETPNISEVPIEVMEWAEQHARKHGKTGTREQTIG